MYPNEHVHQVAGKNESSFDVIIIELSEVHQ